MQTFDGAVYSVVNNFNPMDGSPYYAFRRSPQAGMPRSIMGFDRRFPRPAASLSHDILVSTPSRHGSGQGGQNHSERLAARPVGTGIFDRQRGGELSPRQRWDQQPNANRRDCSRRRPTGPQCNGGSAQDQRSCALLDALSN